MANFTSQQLVLDKDFVLTSELPEVLIFILPFDPNNGIFIKPPIVLQLWLIVAQKRSTGATVIISILFSCMTRPQVDLKFNNFIIGTVLTGLLSHT